MRVIELDNNEDYIVVERIISKDTIYLYLANANDEKDICIRKEVKNEILPLDDEKEFQKAMLLFSKKNKDLMKYLLES